MRVGIRTIGKIVLPVVLAVVVFLGLSTFDLSSSTHALLAYETTCPYTDLEECLVFFQEQANQIRSEQEKLEQSVDAENFEQLSLSQQISYLNSLIQETELKVAEKTVAIEQNTVEIQLLGKEIVSVQNSIDTLTQEIALLEDIMRKRTKTSYKMTFMSPLEILLDSNDFETMMRRMKYLVEAKKKDRLLLADMAVARNQLSDEESILADKRLEVQDIRNTIESEKAVLAEEEANLESQKAQQQVLMAESQRREQQYQQILAQLQGQLNSVEQSVTQLIISMFQKGQLGAGTEVKRGDIIGFQGHTGCSLGSHLHYSISQGYSALNPFSGFLTGGYPITAGQFGPPENNGYLTQGYHSDHLAIDMVDHSNGDQSGATYYKAKGEVSCPNPLWCDNYGCHSVDELLPAYLPLRGEGAPIHASQDGTIYKSTADGYGGNYVIIDHGGGLTSLYLHLK